MTPRRLKRCEHGALSPREPRSIAIVTPAPPGSSAGNRVSARRYARMFRALGHRTRILTDWDGAPADVLVVLHGRRSSGALQRARRQDPELPVVLVLTGTDVYGHPARSRSLERALDAADRIVGLQSHSVGMLPVRWRRKSRVILQSYDGPRLTWHAAVGRPRFLVLGHLRAEKDPFRAALAARKLPPSSRARVLHAGKALSPALEQRARRESRTNSRYLWLGELPRARALKRLSNSTALVHTSRIEGGPSVFSEALALGVPILASRIPASTAILGPRHPGLFTTGRQDELASLMLRVERDPRFAARLAACSRRLAPEVTPARELRAWQKLLSQALLAQRKRAQRVAP